MNKRAMLVSLQVFKVSRIVAACAVDSRSVIAFDTSEIGTSTLCVPEIEALSCVDDLLSQFGLLHGLSKMLAIPNNAAALTNSTLLQVANPQV